MDILTTLFYSPYTHMAVLLGFVALVVTTDDANWVRKNGK